MADIFLSYSHRDNDDMDRVRDAMRGAGLAVWTDENLARGSRNWENAIQASILGAHALVVILTPASSRSEWVAREITMADQNGLPVYPIIAKGDPRFVVPLRLINHQHYDIRTNPNTGIDHFDTNINLLIDGIKTSFRFETLDAETLRAIRLAREAIALFYADNFQQALDKAAEAQALNPDAPIPSRIHTMIEAMVGEIVGV